MTDIESPVFELADKRVWVAGHLGMVGSAITRCLASEGCEILTTSRQQVNLRRQNEVETWMAKAKPEAVFLAAATAGGILANSTRPADFIYDNLAIELNIIHAAYKTGVAKLLFLGASCIYPRAAAQPIVEEALLTGPLEPTNEWYAMAKIAGIKLCQAYRQQHGCDFISAVPTNIYGERDNFDLQSGHVVAALMVKAHRAKLEAARSIDIWGTGKPRREFLHVNDAADALVYLMRHYSDRVPLNVGTGKDISIREFATLICEVVGFEGRLRFDADKPDGMPRKQLDVSRLRDLGWAAKVGLREGLADTYRWFRDHHQGAA